MARLSYFQKGVQQHPPFSVLPLPQCSRGQPPACPCLPVRPMKVSQNALECWRTHGSRGCASSEGHNQRQCSGSTVHACSLTGVPGNTVAHTYVGSSGPGHTACSLDLRWSFSFPGTCSYFPRLPESGHVPKAGARWPHAVTQLRSAKLASTSCCSEPGKVPILYDCH